MSTVIQDTRTALKTTLDAAGLKTFAYEDFAVNAQSPYVTITLDRMILGWADQRYYASKLLFILRLYQIVQTNAQTALAYQDASILKVANALGADLTLGGKVVQQALAEDVDSYFQTIANHRWAVCEFLVEVEPFAADAAA